MWSMASAAPLFGRPIKLLRNGGHQSVDIPHDLELPGTEAVIRRQGDRLIIELVTKRPTMREALAQIAAMGPIEDDWPDINDDDLLPLDDIK